MESATDETTLAPNHAGQTEWSDADELGERLDDAGLAVRGSTSTGSPLEDQQSGASDENNGGEDSSLSALEAELAAECENESEEERPPSVSHWQGELPTKLMRIVDARISIWMKLAEMDGLRGNLREKACAREVNDELARQTREMQKLPPIETLQNALKRLQGKLANPTVANPLQADGKEPPHDQNALYKQALQLGIKQIDLLLRRAQLDAVIPPAAIPAAENEPLMKSCRKHGVKAEKLIGWTYYALAVQTRVRYYSELEQSQRKKAAAIEAEQKSQMGLMGRLLNGKSDGGPPVDPHVTRSYQAAYRELQAIEPQLVELFWELYTELAWLLSKPQGLPEEEQPPVRAALRYGLVSEHPGLIKPEVLAYIKNDVVEDVYDWDKSASGTHVLYADEYIYHISTGSLSVSPDEDLELNARGSDEWRADRVWRQAKICKSREELFRSKHEETSGLVEKFEGHATKIEAKLQEIRQDPKKKAETSILNQKLTSVKAQVTRYRNALDAIETRIIPKVQQLSDDAHEKLEEASTILTPEAITKREALFVRRMARLAARLKEPFPQFWLRDFFQPDRNDHQGRKAMLAQLKEIEDADQRLFHYTLVPHKKIDRQTTVRMSPAFLLAPCRGAMGFAIAPRKWDDNGRLVLPLLSQKQGALANMLGDILADYRWDCSREEAGMDWITADALCSGYATIRWNVRKLPERAQKQMSFDPKLKDRPNWRVHYKLFINSAQEQGRLLFSKSDEVYKLVLRFIGLPPGVEALKRD